MSSRETTETDPLGAENHSFAAPTHASPDWDEQRGSSLSSSSTESTSDPASASSPSSATPIALPPHSTASTTSLPTRARSGSNAPTLASEPTSFTPRAHDQSPLAARLARTAAAAALPPAQLSRRSTNASASSSSVAAYDATTRRNLIAGAASDGDLARLEALLSASAAPPEDDNPDAQDADHPSVFNLANEPNPHTGLAPIHFAAQNGHEDVVKWLVEEAGALPDFEDADGETPLHKAALRGHLDVCRFLLSRQVDVNAADNDGWTPLHNACSRGWLDIARLLLTFHADPNASNRHGFTPLMNASSKGHLPLVHFLLRHPRQGQEGGGADPLRRNVCNETAYDLAACVFEVEICRVLAEAEKAALPSSSSSAAAGVEYNPLASHTTVPVLLHENQRLVTPSLRRPASLVLPTGPNDGSANWSSKALSRNDNRAAFSFPGLLAATADEANELPCFRSEVGLPVVGKENQLVLPPRREVRSGGRVKAHETPPPPPSRSQVGPSSAMETERPRPSPRRTSSSSSANSPSAASSSLAAVLAASSSSSSSAAGSPPADRPPPPAEPAWMWISDWTVDLTSPIASPIDGWSYARSFDASEEEWSALPPPHLHHQSAAGAEAGNVAASGSQKWVRRRSWVRVMRRRLDLPDWGFGDEPLRSVRDSVDGERPDEEEEEELAPMDYRSRARFLVGSSADTSDYSATDVSAGGGGEGATVPADQAEVRKRLAQLERAADELRRGIAEDADTGRRREAERDLEEALRKLALLRTRQDGAAGADAAATDEDENEFIYNGVDATDDDDARSVWMSMRPPSTSSGGARFAASRSTSFQSTHSSRPVLTAQAAPEFRVPTNEVAAPNRHLFSPQLQTQSLRPLWEPDHATNACRRCDKHFSLLNRRHHCRRCGLVVCASCSPHMDQLDPRQVAVEPGSVTDDSPWLLDSPFGYRYRTCNECHAALLALHPSEQAGPASLLSPQAFFPASSSLPGSAAPSEAAASDVSELVECPVCGETLAQLGGKSEQENHIRECLEAGRGSISSGRYLVFRLPPGPLVGEDCNICWTEFEVGDKMARLVCLCTFHEKCLSGWLARGNSCPVHALRE
ncbi:hypothetical protein JCM10908_001642 [Rhodotorula pacifica]|uniref:uncharacterized protein n=1 Tax=Rhodotorula pacifica TaxID=1495444 RepID=UPI00316D0C8D